MTTENASQLPPCPLPDCEGGEHHFHDIYAYTIGDGHDCAKVARIDYRCYGPHRPGLSEPIRLPGITDEMVEAATPGPWEAEGSQIWGPDGVLVAAVREHSTVVDRPDALIIAAAVNALPGLLDVLDVAEAATERVRALHYAANSDSDRTPLCKECQGRAGVHPCGCVAAKDRQPVCGHCNAPGLGQRVSWPCPTIQALDGGESA